MGAGSQDPLGRSDRKAVQSAIGTTSRTAHSHPPVRALLILDHQTLYREAIASFLMQEADLEVLQAASFDEMRQRIGESDDLALVLFRCRPGQPLQQEARELAKTVGREVPLALLDDRLDGLLDDIAALPIAGRIPVTLPSQQLPHVIRLLLAGGRYAPAPAESPGGEDGLADGNLSMRDRRVLQWLAEGSTNKEVAAQLGLQEVTVKVIIGRLLRRFEARNRAQLVGIARSRNLV